MGHVEPAHGGGSQPPGRSGWSIALKVVAYMILTVVVVAIVFVGLLFVVCGGLSRR